MGPNMHRAARSDGQASPDGEHPSPFRSEPLDRVMNKDEARAVFERAAARTRERSPATFDQWFGGIQYDDLTDGVLTLRAQNEFVMDWVRTNFLPDLLEQIRSESGWAVQVSWILDARLESPV